MFSLRSLFILILCNYSLGLLAQNGCTDSTANNFDPAAKNNDGTCLYDPLVGHPILKTELKQVSESSGLLLSNGKLWTFGDSGNPPELFSVDTVTGNVLQIVHIRNYPNNDWEDITADKTSIYIDDAGNNYGNRTDLRILKIAKSDIGDTKSVSVNAEAIEFSYQDQKTYTINKQNNFDCEAIMAVRDSIYLFSKDRGDYKTRVYALPKIAGSYKIVPIDSFNTNGMVCGADYDSISNEIALVGYEGHHVDPFVYLLYGFRGNHFFDGNRKRISIGNPNTEWQTEGVVFKDRDDLYISCESTSNNPSGLYTMNIDQSSLTSGYSPISEAGKLKCYPNPASDHVTVQCGQMIKDLELYNILGDALFSTKVDSQRYTLPLSYHSGVYWLKVNTSSVSITIKLIITKN